MPGCESVGCGFEHKNYCFTKRSILIILIDDEPPDSAWSGLNDLQLDPSHNEFKKILNENRKMSNV